MNRTSSRGLAADVARGATSRSVARRGPALRIVAFSLVCASPLSAWAADRRVPQQFETIQAAVDAASPNDRIVVGPGVYSENVVASKDGLQFVGSRATIDGVGLGQTGTQKIIRNLLRKIPLKVNLTIRGPFRSLIATAKAYRDPRQVIEEVLPRPLDEVPGIVTEVRRKEEDQQQSQTPVEENVEPIPPATPTSER